MDGRTVSIEKESASKEEDGNETPRAYLISTCMYTHLAHPSTVQLQHEREGGGGG